jgi:hypothetical protein
MLCQVWPAAASLHSLCQLSGSQGSGGPPGCCRRRKLEFLTIVLKQFPGLLPIPTWWSSVMWKISTCYSELGGLGRWLPSLRTSMESLGCSRKQLGCIRQQCTWLYLPFFESSKVSKHQVKKAARRRHPAAVHDRLAQVGPQKVVAACDKAEDLHLLGSKESWIKQTMMNIFKLGRSDFIPFGT